MLDKIDHDIVKGMLVKVFQNLKLNIDTIQVNEEREQINYRVIFRFQVTHKTEQSEGIEWRFRTVDIFFKPKPLYVLLNDNYFDSLFHALTKRVNNENPHYKMKFSLDSTKNEELVH